MGSLFISIFSYRPVPGLIYPFFSRERSITSVLVSEHGKVDRL